MRGKARGKRAGRGKRELRGRNGLSNDHDMAPGRPAGPPPYPRRRVVRFVLKRIAAMAFSAVGRLKVEGEENIPAQGPVILVANHFHFADPVALLHVSRRQVEFVGGFRFVNAPRIVRFLPHLWGYFPAFRGAYSRSTLRSAVHVLERDGVVAIFPEGGSWADTLRPGRPGAAFVALETQAPIVPIGLSGFTGLFRQWRPELTVRVGRPIGPFGAEGAAGRARRQEIERTTEAIMRSIAELVPPERRGVYSDDPQLREAGAAVAAFPFEREGMRGL